MMCHPTTGDLLLGLDHRLLPGLYVRGRVRSGGHVFHLHGWVPSRRAGLSPAHLARTAAQSTGQVQTARSISETHSQAQQHQNLHSSPARQHSAANRVGLIEAALTEQKSGTATSNGQQVQDCFRPINQGTCVPDHVSEPTVHGRAFLSSHRVATLFPRPAAWQPFAMGPAINIPGRLVIPEFAPGEGRITARSTPEAVIGCGSFRRSHPMPCLQFSPVFAAKRPRRAAHHQY